MRLGKRIAKLVARGTFKMLVDKHLVKAIKAKLGNLLVQVLGPAEVGHCNPTLEWTKQQLWKERRGGLWNVWMAKLHCV
jgi:hypothetical protein